MPSPRGVAVVLVSLLVSVAALSTTVLPGYAVAPETWPPSTDLVIAAVVTGGVSASDEYVEIYNAGSVSIDLGGCQLDYVTASGATTTRKVVFASPLPLVAGQHLLVANSAGAYGPLADATYAGGLAGDGGSLVLRRVGGAAIDAVGWGTAASSYVEGAVAPAPPARSSLERRPGGIAGNWIDTNDNASDWVVQSNPVPESLASAPLPGPSATPSETSSSIASGADTANPTPESPTVTPTPEQAASPSVCRSVEPTVEPSVAPSVEPTPASPAPTDPDVDLESIAAARLQQPGTQVHLAGVVTAPPGLVGAESLIAIADSSGGIFVRLSASTDGLEIGRSIEVHGVLSAPYGQLEVRELEWLVLGSQDAAPTPVAAALPEIGEWLAGSLVTVEGRIDSVQSDDGRLALSIGDGQNALRILADPRSGIFKADVARGEWVALTGIVGQHATALGREDGYRLWLRQRGDLIVVPVASPSASPSGSPAASAAPSAARTHSPTATPTATPVFHDLATGLAVRGRIVDVDATVTASVGIIDWGGPTIVVDDGTAAVAVVLPAGAADPRVGARERVVGKVGSLHNGRRVVASLVEPLGEAAATQPRQVSGPLGPEHEWQLVEIVGRVVRLTRAGLRWRADLTVDGHAVQVLGEPGAGIAVSGITPGRTALIIGIVRRSTSDSDTFQLLPRSPADLRLGPAPAGSSGAAAAGLATAAAGTGTPGAGATTPIVSVAEIASREGYDVAVAGLIVDAGDGTATLDDGTGRLRLGGAAAADALSLLEPGDAIEVTGRVSRDADGWLIAVDPERIVALAGAGPSGDAPSTGATPTAPRYAGTGAGPLDDANGLARPAAGLGASNPSPIVAILGAALLALIALLGLGAATIASGRSRFSARPRRPRLDLGLRRQPPAQPETSPEWGSGTAEKTPDGAR